MGIAVARITRASLKRTLTFTSLHITFRCTAIMFQVGLITSEAMTMRRHFANCQLMRLLTAGFMVDIAESTRCLTRSDDETGA